MTQGLPERFWAKVRMTHTCWNWIGYVSPRGYGMYSLCGQPNYAHRVIYAHAVGDLVDGLEIDHLCRNRRCVNPEHLEQVTRAENQRRGNSATGINGRKRECHVGHPLHGPNLYLRPNGHRMCRTCAGQAAFR